MTEPRRVRLKPHEFDVVDAADEDGYLSVIGDERVRFIHKSMVEDVEPPLPPEPPPMLYLDRSLTVWRHTENAGWYDFTTDRWVGWADAYKCGPMVPLVSINPDDPKQVEVVTTVLDDWYGEVRNRKVAIDILRALVEGAQQ